MEDKTEAGADTRIQVYLATWAALVGLTLLTVWFSSTGFGGAGSFVPFLIASIKAVLVLAFFMHLWYEGRLLRLFPAIAVAVMAAVLMLVISDAAYRG